MSGLHLGGTGSRNSSLYQPFLDEDEREGLALDEDDGGGGLEGVVLFERWSWAPWAFLVRGGRRVTVTSHLIRVEEFGGFPCAACCLLLCCRCCRRGLRGRRTSSSTVPLVDVRDLALDRSGLLGRLWPAINVYSRHDPHRPALHLSGLRGATAIFTALREAVSEVQARELTANSDI